MKLNKEKAFEVFFGTFELPEGIIIITPISKIYKEIQSQHHFIEKSKGWWQRTKTHINSTPVTILKIPQGYCIKDCLKTFDYKKIKKVIFLGFCGSLNQNIKIGEMVIPQTAIFKNLKAASRIRLRRKYRIKTVSSIILDPISLKKLLRNKINLLDMETYFLYSWGERYKVKVISILIVTDQPISLPFFLCKEKEVKLINNSISRLANRVGQYL